MDTEELIAKLDMLGESAHERAVALYVKADKDINPTTRAATFNDYFYWSGKATAYKGIAAGLVLADMVAGDVDAEPSCP